jgi:hypothetical protein
VKVPQDIRDPEGSSNRSYESSADAYPRQLGNPAPGVALVGPSFDETLDLIFITAGEMPSRWAVTCEGDGWVYIRRKGVDQHVEILDGSATEPSIYHARKTTGEEPTWHWIVESHERKPRVLALQSEAVVEPSLLDARFQPK